MIAKMVAEQFRQPSGFLGRLVGNFMARGNAYEIGWTVSLLDIQTHDRILEVGFGPGVGIQLASQRAPQGLVAGVDVSQTMAQVAAKRNAAGIQAGRVELRQGDVTTLPYDGDSFDKAFAIHSIYFWPRPVEGLKELRRVLKAGGLLVITLLPQDKWQRRPPTDVFALYDAAEIERFFADSGFRETHVDASPQADRFQGVAIRGVK